MSTCFPIRSAVVAVVCAAATCAGTGTALAVGTTITPAGAPFNVRMTAGGRATFVTPIGTVTCTESTSSGEVPTRPSNANTEEANASVGMALQPLAFGTCSFPGARSASVVRSSTEEWSASGRSETEDEFDVNMPEEALRITIVNPNGTCTIVTPSQAGGVVGVWSDGVERRASTTTVNGELSFTASGTCRVGCAHLEETGVLYATIGYDVTNGEAGESIVF